MFGFFTFYYTVKYFYLKRKINTTKRLTRVLINDLNVNLQTLKNNEKMIKLMVDNQSKLNKQIHLFNGEILGAKTTIEEKTRLKLKEQLKISVINANKRLLKYFQSSAVQ